MGSETTHAKSTPKVAKGPAGRSSWDAANDAAGPWDRDHPVTVAMIQALIPLGLKAVEEALLGEVEQLAAPRWGDAASGGGALGRATGVGVPRRSEAGDRGIARAGSGGGTRGTPHHVRRAPAAARARCRALRRVLGRISCRERHVRALVNLIQVLPKDTTIAMTPDTTYTQFQIDLSRNPE